jgi:Domain of unknown function (DUF1841)
MNVFASHTREQLRQVYSDAWRKHLAGVPLSPLEAMIADVIGLHPEYQAVIADLGKTPAFEANVLNAGENPFMHMGLHLAVREQISIDRPPGVRELHRLLHARHGDVHTAEHVLMEALGEILWHAQRSATPPDEAQYLALARRRLNPASKR